MGLGSESIGNAVLTKDGIEDRTKAFELNASEALSLFNVALTAADPETRFIFRSLDKPKPDGPFISIVHRTEFNEEP